MLELNDLNWKFKDTKKERRMESTGTFALYVNNSDLDNDFIFIL